MKELYKIICKHLSIVSSSYYPKYIYHFIKIITLYVSIRSSKNIRCVYTNNYRAITFLSIDDANKWYHCYRPSFVLQKNKINDCRRLHFKTDDYDTVYNMMNKFLFCPILD